jgi:dTMP kinase
MNRGCFIVLEGVEGAGKSTQLEALRQALEQRGINALYTREPGGTPVGEAIRAILLDPEHRDLHADAELLLMFAARAQHVHAVIAPALASGRWVVCDRFIDATYAYQGGGREIDPQRISTLDAWTLQGLRPDLTLVLDMPPKEGLARALRARAADRFEQEPLMFFERVRQIYLDRAQAAPQRYRVLDASRPAAEVSVNLYAALAAFFNWT